MAYAASDDDQLRDGQRRGDRGLSPEEDRELRQLTWFAQAGSLSSRSVARLSELMARDRRKEVRDIRPNPSSPTADEVSTLPPLRPDGPHQVTCPNCGSLFMADPWDAGPQASRPPDPT